MNELGLTIDAFPAVFSPQGKVRPHGLGTRSIHAGEAPDPVFGAHGVPIYQNATFRFRSYDHVHAWRDGSPHFLYACESNPTVRAFERTMADLEGAEDAVATATGMAAISAALIQLAAGGIRRYRDEQGYGPI
jgi:O-acetylhomoserine/O-acetylserine sulfhydrylase-like pyridoxal-dependent enzyme